MNLLPKCHQDFSKEDYWNKFFKTRGDKAFEWYGEYPELCGIISKFVKTKDEILIVGCGNSKLSTDLYDVGYRNVTSIDISKVVIEQMKERNRIDRPDLVFDRMDATQMSYSNDQFSVVLDKGTLDALMPDDSPETTARIDKYFDEISRVLRKGGRYICISLLQNHILRKLVSYFTSSHFMFRITRCHDAENSVRDDDGDGSRLPVFVVMATKFPGLSQQVLELVLTEDSITKVPTPDQLIETVLSVQQSSLVCNRLKKKNLTDVDEVVLDLCKPGDDNPKYTIYVVDLHESKGKSYEVFLVPQGRENHWLFSTKEGRRNFAETVKADRLVIVILRRNQKFGDWEKVKEELNESVKDLAPPNLPKNFKILYKSLGADVGKRKVLCEIESSANGRIAVDEICTDKNEKYRRLIFLHNQFVIQSDAKLKPITIGKRKTKDVVDHGVLACEHHAYMCVGVNLVVRKKSLAEVLIVGLGGGGLPMFLYHCYPKLKITTVDIDETVLTVAKEWFDFVVDERQTVEIADGIKYLEESAIIGRFFDVILFDVNTNDPSLGMSCPPKEFLTSSVLSTVSYCLKPQGILILNLVCRDQTLRPKVIEDLKKAFPFLTSIKMENTVNEIIFCSKKNELDKQLWESSAVNLNNKVKDKKLLSDDVINVNEMLESLIINSS